MEEAETTPGGREKELLCPNTNVRLESRGVRLVVLVR